MVIYATKTNREMETFKINKKLLWILVVILIFFCNCNEIKNNNEKIIKELTIPELIKTTYELRKDDIFLELCQLLNDSILANKYFWLQTITEINEEFKTIDWGFSVEQNYPPSVSTRLLFDVCINNDNKILIQNKYVNINEIKALATEYIFNPDIIDKHITNVNVDVDFLGTMNISQVMAVLSINVKNKKGLSVEEWTLFFDCMYELMSVFEEKKNEIANNKWGNNFDLLNYEQKLAITKIVDFRLSLFFE